MSHEVVVHKNRTNTVIINLGIDVSGDAITSEIRSDTDVNSPLLATWVVAFETDGSDGRLILTLDDSETEDIKANSGYMDLKRMSGGEPLPVFDRPLQVTFRGSVTV